jgi:hypothetical protein
VPCHQPTIQPVLGQQTSREDPFQRPRADLRLHTGLEIPSPFHCSSGFALNLNASEKNLLLVLAVFTHALTQPELATKSSFAIVSVVNASPPIGNPCLHRQFNFSNNIPTWRAALDLDHLNKAP